MNGLKPVAVMEATHIIQRMIAISENEMISLFPGLR